MVDGSIMIHFPRTYAMHNDKNWTKLLWASSMVCVNEDQPGKCNFKLHAEHMVVNREYRNKMNILLKNVMTLI